MINKYKMSTSFKAWIAVHVMLLGLATANTAMASTPLTLAELLEDASTYYPVLQAARLEKQATEQDFEAAKRLSWPTVNAVTESTSNKTNALSTIPSRSVQVEQTLWDAGQIKSRVSESKTQTEIQASRTALLQEDVFLQLTNAWQNLLASAERMQVAKHTIQRLENYQKQMSRRVDVEASPRIDLELANSRILQTQVEYTLANTAFKQAVTRIEQYTGRSNLLARLIAPDTISRELVTSELDSLMLNSSWKMVAERHPSITKTKAETLQSKDRLDQKKAEAFPQLYVRVSQPLSNLPGYATGPTAFLGLRYSTSPGFSNQLQAQALATRVASSEELVHASMAEMVQLLQLDHDEYVSAKSRIDSLEKSVQGADQVLGSYQRQFQAGKKTWQDLLNAARELAQTQYALADARASMVGALHRLQIRSGLKVQ